MFCHSRANCTLDKPTKDSIGEQILDLDRVANIFRVLSRQISGRFNLDPVYTAQESRRLSFTKEH